MSLFQLCKTYVFVLYIYLVIKQLKLDYVLHLRFVKKQVKTGKAAQ